MSDISETTVHLDPGAAHSVTARAPVRSQLAADVEAFLAAGGSIVEVPRDFRADPPKRPDSLYGRGAL